MKVGIFGQHPDVKRGFNSAMTLMWAMALEKRGHEVSIFIRSDTLKCSPNELNRYGYNFNIVSLAKDEAFPHQDLLIWQSYHRKDHEDYWDTYKRADGLKAKNFPRLFTGNYKVDLNRYLQSTAAFDAIFVSLYRDYVYAQKFFSAKNVFYVPRGFSAKHLQPNFNSEGFTVSVDVRKSSAPNTEDYDVFIKAKEKLGKRVKMQALGINIPQFHKVNRGSVLDFYDLFLKPSKVYAFVDRNGEYRDKHILPGGYEVYCGVYENSIVEAQMSGSMVIAPGRIVDEELITNGFSGILLRDDYSENDFFQALMYCMENHERFWRKIREDAIRRHSLVALGSAVDQAITKMHCADS